MAQGQGTGALSAAAAPLNEQSLAMWRFQALEPRAVAHNVTIVFRLPRAVDVERLQSAVRNLVAAHPPLRTRYPLREGVPFADVVEVAGAARVINVSSVELMTRLRQLAAQPFDLAVEFPFRACLLDVDDGSRVLCMVVHHIVFDAESIEIVLADLQRAYDGVPLADAYDVPAEDPGEPVESHDYWRRHLEGFDARRLELYPGGRAGAGGFAGGHVFHPLGDQALGALRALRRDIGLSTNMVLLAVYYLLLVRHGAGPDLAVGVPVTTRRGPAVRIGNHVSFLPLRVTVDPAESFRRLAECVRDTLVAAVPHADMSYESMLGVVELRSTDWRRPLFRHIFNFHPMAGASGQQVPLIAEWIPVDSGECLLDLEFVAHPSRSDMVIEAVHRFEAVDEGYARALLERFERLLCSAAEAPDRPVAELDMWRPGERALISAANNTRRVAGSTRTVLERILARAAGTPAAPAVVDGAGQVSTYAELVRRSAAIRERLAELGVRRGDVVAVALGRSAELVAATLAVWSLGAAYLPLDPVQPARRHDFQLADAGVTVIVTDREPSVECRSGRTWVATVDVVTDETRAAALPTVRADPASNAYVIYTSGSTGRPKGVEITHGNLVNLTGSFASHLDVGERDRTLWLTTFAFDISALEVFLPLSVGASVLAAPDEAQLDPRRLLALVRRHDVTILQATPTTWRLVAQAPELTVLAGRTVLSGGEPMSAALARKLLRSGCRLFNVYGPTETTIWSTLAEIDDAVVDPVPIGRPIDNTVVFVLDPSGQPAPVGIPGELCIAGSGVARGYVGQPGLTADRFGVRPDVGRYYRTGDTARWRPDGSLEVLGRSDRQVKLRGHRLELGEIEAVLEEHGGVAAAAAVLRGSESEAVLIGYVQTVDAAGPDFEASLWEHVQQSLPRYALPVVEVIPELPRNTNGKIDYGALPEPRAANSPMMSQEASDELVGQLIKVWEEVLGHRPLYADTNFFARGGHSLLAVLLATRVQAMTGLEVTLDTVFTASTPRRMAQTLRVGGGPGAVTG